MRAAEQYYPSPLYPLNNFSDSLLSPLRNGPDKKAQQKWL